MRIYVNIQGSKLRTFKWNKLKSTPGNGLIYSKVLISGFIN